MVTQKSIWSVDSFINALPELTLRTEDEEEKGRSFSKTNNSEAGFSIPVFRLLHHLEPARFKHPRAFSVARNIYTVSFRVIFYLGNNLFRGVTQAGRHYEPHRPISLGDESGRNWRNPFWASTYAITREGCRTGYQRFHFRAVFELLSCVAIYGGCVPRCKALQLDDVVEIVNFSFWHTHRVFHSQRLLRQAWLQQKMEIFSTQPSN